MNLIPDSDAVCTACRHKGAHAADCPSPTPWPMIEVPEAIGLTDPERHELECLRHRVQQLAYPCSPHCDGYLREQALANTAWKAVRLYTRQIESGAGAHVIVEAERQDGTTVEVIRSFADIDSTIIDHWARLPEPGDKPPADIVIRG